MLFKALSSLVILFCTLSHLTSVLSAPLDKYDLDSTARKFLARATPAATHFVIYSDKFVSGDTGPPPASQVEVRIFRI